MHLVKLIDYQDERRAKKSHVSISCLRKQAQAGKIPGAFKMDDGGDWWVDLDTHDEVIKERIESQMVEIPATQSSQAAPANDDEVVASILESMSCHRATV